MKADRVHFEVCYRHPEHRRSLWHRSRATDGLGYNGFYGCILIWVVCLGGWEWVLELNGVGWCEFVESGFEWILRNAPKALTPR